jgi:hypothetical protein
MLSRAVTTTVHTITRLVHSATVRLYDTRSMNSHALTDVRLPCIQWPIILRASAYERRTACAARIPRAWYRYMSMYIIVDVRARCHASCLACSACTPSARTISENADFCQVCDELLSASFESAFAYCPGYSIKSSHLDLSAGQNTLRSTFDFRNM